MNKSLYPHIVVPRKGEYYMDACLRVVKHYFDLSSEGKQEVVRCPEFIEAFDHLAHCHPAHVRVSAGENLVWRVIKDANKLNLKIH